jgi:general L-amino acid transport system permease protein
MAGLGWWVSPLFRSDQAIIVTQTSQVMSFDDFEPVFLARIDRDKLNEAGIDQATLDTLNSAQAVADLKKSLGAELDAAKLEAELEAQAANAETAATRIEALETRLDALNEAEITLCAVSDTPAEINAAGQLRRRALPVNLESAKSINEASKAYAAGDCDLLAGDQAELAAVQANLETPAEHALISVSAPPLVMNLPTPAGFNIRGGTKLSPEFAALLAGLVIFTSAFAAEIVRAGILAVSKGQTEAARALGLDEGQRLWLIVLPQALRVIIPPMTNQYLNLTKNSSLAVAIGFPDLVAVGNTVMNQSGLAVQVIIIFMLSYLIISLSISAFLNWYNRRVALVER